MITSVTIGESPSNLSGPSQEDVPLLSRATQQMAEYLTGQRREFELPVSLSGTAFQEAIWSALQLIPFGVSVTYAELGEAAGVGKAPRAVGGAVGRNPIPIIVPCHRILGASGTVTGYSAGEGIVTKEKLLKLEGIPFS